MSELYIFVHGGLGNRIGQLEQLILPTSETPAERLREFNVIDMLTFKSTAIWQRTFGKDFGTHQEEVERLISALDHARGKASELVKEIATDLPTFTVHDVTHLDALWESADQISGDEIELNPIEGFILGCAFLFHDAGMTVSAYPGGIDEIREDSDFQTLKKRLSSGANFEFQEDELIQVFLREQHAKRAQELPSIEWPGDRGSFYLIENSNFREKFGDLIGLVAASHWWDHLQLESRLAGQIIPAPAPFPGSWSIDLLKIACILRTSDAAQIDEQRAPGFLRALRRSRLSTFAADHWTFQNKLSQAQRRNDQLHFAGLRPFTRAEANAWWLMYETLQMIDKELRQTNSLLSRTRGSEARLAARSVANIETPISLQESVPTSGWLPIDTSFKIHDIPELVSKLGGTQLYGENQFVAVRELVQNAMDATRLRALVDPNAPEPKIKVDITQREGIVTLRISDNGVGMGFSEITENLLGFGSSGWIEDESFGKYTNEFAEPESFSGKFGIGFFSCFMLGDKICVKSRRFDGTPDGTYALEFENGPRTRPILSSALREEKMTSGGTEISIELIPERYSGISLGGYSTRFWELGRSGYEALCECLSLTFPASEVPIEVSTNTKTSIIDGRDWRTVDVETLLRRIEGPAYLSEHQYSERAVVPIVDDGVVVGRAALIPNSVGPSEPGFFQRDLGVTVSKGAKISNGRFRGLMLGSSTRISRDHAKQIASASSLSDWASKQAKIWSNIDEYKPEHFGLSEMVASLGGDVDRLKICEIGGRLLDKYEFLDFVRSVDEVRIASKSSVFQERPVGVFSELAEETVFTSDGMHIGIGESIESPYNLKQLLEHIVIREFSISKKVICAMRRKLNDHMQTILMCDVPAWQLEDGSCVTVRGTYYKRKMSVKDVKLDYS